VGISRALPAGVRFDILVFTKFTMSQEIIQLLATPRRRQILRLVWDRELSAGAVHRALPSVTFGAVSQHLRALEQAGVLQVRREGRSRLYRARRTALGALRSWLERHWEDALWELKIQAEAEQARRGPRPHRTSRK
jgi:DNA-binding transcriptional ArsR family regulator